MSKCRTHEKTHNLTIKMQISNNIVSFAFQINKDEKDCQNLICQRHFWGNQHSVQLMGVEDQATFTKGTLVILSQCKICKLISREFSQGTNCANINCFCTNMLITSQFITVLLKIMENFKKRHQYLPTENSQSKLQYI